jgi:hypothetical protein
MFFYGTCLHCDQLANISLCNNLTLHDDHFSSCRNQPLEEPLKCVVFVIDEIGGFIYFSYPLQL